MYDDLVKRLREVEEMLKVAQFKEAENLIGQAADAVEELQRKIDEFYFLAQDVNRKEIAWHISENNLDTWLYAFHKYAAQIARKPLPEPPKEE